MESAKVKVLACSLEELPRKPGYKFDPRSRLRSRFETHHVQM